MDRVLFIHNVYATEPVVSIPTCPGDEVQAKVDPVHMEDEVDDVVNASKRDLPVLSHTVRYTFIQIAKKNSSKNTFIQKHFHPKTLSSKNTFVQNHFIQKRRQFHPRHFHPKTGSSNDTFIQKRFRPMTLSSKNGFVQ